MKRPGLIRALIFLYTVCMLGKIVLRLDRYEVRNRIPIVHMSPLIEPEQVVSISNLITHIHENNNASINDCLIQIDCRFPYVNNVKIIFQSNSTIEYIFSVALPLCRINNRYILTDSGTVCLQNIYDESSIGNLVCVQVDQSELQQEKSMRELAHMIQQANKAMFERYDLYWKNSHYIQLSSKNNQNFKVICDSFRIPDTAILDHCEHIGQEFQLNQQKQSLGIFADVRFAKQIVVYSKMGGRYG